MKKYNCIVVFDKEKSHILFCKRTKEPYKGLYNFVGGKVEQGESSRDAAYRELLEETGITRGQIRLYHFMDLTYYYQKMVLELYVGQLEQDIELIPEVNPLKWFVLTEDFTDPTRFAGEQNIAHIVNVALKYPLEEQTPQLIYKGKCIGVDGCKKGWIAAVLQDSTLRVEYYETIQKIVEAHLDFDYLLIDMAIGLPSSMNQAEARPDVQARKMLGKRGSSVFPIPCRQAFYAKTEEEQKSENVRVLGKSLSKQTLAIMPKIHEVDEFMNANPNYHEKIQESHPEVCFQRLSGEKELASKTDFLGYTQRKNILSGFCEDADAIDVWQLAKELKCKPDDIVDAMCLAVTANLRLQGKTVTIPEIPMKDEKGLTMQLVVPKKLN